jgi:hypothetical protein
MKNATDGAKADERLAALQNEKLVLECEKLRGEIAELKSPKGFSDKVSRHSVLVSMVLAMLGFGFGIYQYREQQEENRKAAEVQSKKEREAADERTEQERKSRDREFMKPLWEKQLNTYFEASEAAATIATTTDAAEREKARNKFWMLYQGPLVIVESPSVSGAMKAFGDALGAKTNADLKTLSLELASAFQESVIEGANLRLDEFRKGKFDYRK